MNCKKCKNTDGVYCLWMERNCIPNFPPFLYLVGEGKKKIDEIDSSGECLVYAPLVCSNGYDMRENNENC